MSFKRSVLLFLLFLNNTTKPLHIPERVRNLDPKYLLETAYEYVSNPLECHAAMTMSIFAPMAGRIFPRAGNYMNRWTIGGAGAATGGFLWYNDKLPFGKGPFPFFPKKHKGRVY